MNWAKNRQWLKADWSIGQAASMAVFLESSAPKAGNVSPFHAFSDMDYTDFLASGLAIAPVFDRAQDCSVGQLVKQAITVTRVRCGLNTNLGTVLLMAPLAKALHQRRLSPGETQLATETQRVLNALTPTDAELIYEAILIAKPGGLGRSSELDVQHSKPPSDVRQAMALAAPVDAVARQYVNNFADVREKLCVWLRRGLQRGAAIGELVAEIQLRYLACELDGLIIRKSGSEIAIETQQLAVWALDEYLETGQCGTRWQALDSFLRSDGHNRNPGTTADLIAAALFVLLLDPQPDG